MLISSLLLSATAIFLIGAGVTYDQGETGKNGPAGSRDAGGTIKEVYRFFDNWQAAERARDIDRLVNAMDSDCVVLPPGQDPIRGREAVRAMYERFFQAYKNAVIDHQFLVEDVEVSGEYAFFWGTDEIKIIQHGGQTVQGKGHGMGILKRGPDGLWRTYRSINNIARQQP